MKPMEEKNEEDLYRNFSRKDLQGLCKKYGLPARKSNSEMATSLILYLEKKNIKSKSTWEGCRSDPYLSLWTELEGKMNSGGNQRTDLREMSSHDGFGQFQKHREPDQNDLRRFKHPTCSDKVSEDMGHLTQLQRGSNSGTGDIENAFSSVLSSTAEASLSTFDYHISCDDGIELYVDLNSTTSDWIESLKSGVHSCHDSYDYKSSASDEREGPSIFDSHNNSQLKDESSPTPIGGTNILLQANQVGVEQATLPSTSKFAPEVKSYDFECLIREENEVGTYSNASSLINENNPKFSKTGKGVYIESCSQKTCIPPDPVCKISGLSGSPFASIGSSSSRTIQFGPLAPDPFLRNIPLMWPVQTVDRRQYEPSLEIMRSHRDVGHQKAQTQLSRGCEKTRPNVPFQRLSPSNVNFDNSIKAGNGRFIRSHEAGREGVELSRKDPSISPFNLASPLDLAVQKKKKSNHCNFCYTNNVEEDMRRSQGRINLGSSKGGDGNTSSEIIRFRQSIKESGVNLASSEYKELCTKRHFSSIGDQSHSGNPEAKIIRTSKQISGDMGGSRKKSMKSNAKWNVHDKIGDAHDNL